MEKDIVLSVVFMASLKNLCTILTIINRANFWTRPGVMSCNRDDIRWLQITSIFCQEAKAVLVKCLTFVEG